MDTITQQKRVFHQDLRRLPISRSFPSTTDYTTIWVNLDISITRRPHPETSSAGVFFLVIVLNVIAKHLIFTTLPKSSVNSYNNVDDIAVDKIWAIKVKYCLGVCALEEVKKLTSHTDLATSADVFFKPSLSLSPYRTRTYVRDIMHHRQQMYSVPITIISCNKNDVRLGPQYHSTIPWSLDCSSRGICFRTRMAWMTLYKIL